MSQLALHRYIKRIESLRIKEFPPDRPEHAVFVQDIEFSRLFGFERLGLHHIVIPPGSRTSFPHAESHEEEFVFVLLGHPDLWINGFIHHLRPGHAVGFVAGTGIAHNFINNSDQEVHLLVAGERSKSQNLCSFPINPELKAECPIWWADPPSHSFGPHDGRPGPIRPEDRATSESDCVLFCPDQPKGKLFHYPGDNESFGSGFRVSSRLGLKALGIWYETLMPGRRSAFPHAHTHEEEFVYVLRGRAKIWINGSVQEVGPDSVAAFPSHTGLAHTIINDGDEDLVYICIGEAQEFDGEKIIYPLNPLRQQECEKKGFGWQDPPVHEWGPHNGRPLKEFSDHLSLRLCSSADEDLVLELFRKSQSYFGKVEDAIPSLGSVRKAMADQPPQTSDKYFKEFLIIESDGVGIGIVDLHVHHPEAGVCYLGLLLIQDELHGRGLGRRSYELIEDYVKRALQCSSIRLGISQLNNVAGFWAKMGFVKGDHSYVYRGENRESLVQEFFKILES